MTLDPIALAVPFFFLLIGLELLVARARHRRVYRFTDSFADLGCGVTQRVVLLLFEAALLAGYAFVHAHARLWTFAPSSVWPWVIAIVGVDLAYYWWHRLSHEVNVLWAVHVVHHQSEDYNLAVALRQAVLSPVTVMPFYLPLAVLGVPLTVFFIVNALSTLYQFWIHTELVDRMGAAGERHQHALAPPGAPRGEPEYLDRNYAATFILWDQLFGTLRREEAPPVYGVSHPLRSFDPVWAQVQPLWGLVQAVRRAPSAGEAIRFLLASPAWHPEWLGPRTPVPRSGPRGAAEVRRAARPAAERLRRRAARADHRRGLRPPHLAPGALRPGAGDRRGLGPGLARRRAPRSSRAGAGRWGWRWPGWESSPARWRSSSSSRRSGPCSSPAAERERSAPRRRRIAAPSPRAFVASATASA